MGQIIGSAAKPKRCNLNKLSQLGTPAAGEHVLVSSDNSMNAAGQGNFDCYIIGDGTTAATALELISIENEVLKYLPEEAGIRYLNPVIGVENTYIKTNGTTASYNNWYISQPIHLNKGETLHTTGYGSGCAWLSYASQGNTYQVIQTATAYQAEYSWTAPNDCDVVISGNGAGIYKIAISAAGKLNVAPLTAWTALEQIVNKHLSPAMIDGKRIIGSNSSSYYGTESSDADYQATEYIDVEGVGVIYITCYGTSASSNNYGAAFYNAQKTAIQNTGLTFYGESANNNNLRAFVVPSGAKYLRSTFLKGVGSFECYVVDTNALVEELAKINQISASVNNIGEVVSKSSDGLLKKVRSQNLLQAFHDFRYVDIMYLTGNSNAPASKIGIFTPTASTATTLTFGSDDAACLDKQLALVCKTSSDNYYVCQFTAAENSTITLLYDYGANIDLSSVVGLMSIHDTYHGGQGQHLSPWGYKAIAQEIARQSMSKHWIFNRVIDGISIVSCGTTSYNEPSIVDLNGNVIKEVEYNSLVAFGGAINSICTSSVANNKNGTGGWCTKAFFYRQNAVGAKITMNFPQERMFCGFVKIVCQCDTNEGIKVNIRKTDGTLIESKFPPRMFAPIYFEIDTAIDGIVLEVETLIADSIFRMTSISIVENYSGKIKPINETSIVACFGSSNTQYPPSNASYINLVDGDPFNELVVRPDGTIGDGYGYYPKELAKVTGAVVDNWGKSGEWTTYGLAHIKSLFDNKRYTHVILSFFANDMNASASYEGIIENIWEMCEYVKGHGAIPVIMTSYGTAATSQTTWFGMLHEFLQLGISNPNIVYS